jgi:hypothetical protein
MSEATASSEASVADQPVTVWPGEKLYGLGRKMLMLCFFGIFLLIAHQRFFTGYLRSKPKLIMLMIIAPFVVVGGCCCLIGWWQMKLAGAFVRPGVAEEQVEQKRERRRREESDLLPWQRRDR